MISEPEQRASQPIYSPDRRDIEEEETRPIVRAVLVMMGLAILAGAVAALIKNWGAL